MNLRRMTVCLLVGVLLLLSLMASPVVASTYYAASLWVAAEGRCTIGFNPYMVWREPHEISYSTWEYLDRAVGSFVFVVGAQVTDQVHTQWYGDLYPAVEGTVKTYGWLRTSWFHGNEAYGLNLFIYSSPITAAMIGCDPDAFIHSDIYMPTEKLLGFTGTLRRGLAVERVQGNLGFLLTSGSLEPSGERIFVVIFHIYSLIDGKAVEFWWADTEVRAVLYPDQQIVIPAARIFMHEVSINPL